VETVLSLLALVLDGAARPARDRHRLRARAGDAEEPAPQTNAHGDRGDAGLLVDGSTVHPWQVVGWTPINPIPGMVFPFRTGTWFGLHAAWACCWIDALLH
jgi:hypothetical protein